MLEMVDNLFDSCVCFCLRSILKGAQCSSMAELKGKTVIITGASGGVGHETAFELANRGARIILACRDETKGNETLLKLKSQTRNKNIIVMKLDLASFKSIKQFAKKFIEQESSLHILINNAGVMCCPKTITEDGFETHFQVNYLGPFLLTHMLLDTLKNSSPSRIINVSAIAYRLGKINFDDLNFENTDYVEGDAYSQSKLALVHFTTEMSKQLKDSGVTVNTVHPGICNTNIYRYMGFRSNSFLSLSFAPICYALMKTSKDGAQTTIQCAVAEELQEVTGKFFSECREEALTESGCDDDVASKLYIETKKLLKLD
ncbi:retinol dehydrogenase 13-like isoform X2 [Tubulanus polymorphus]|uniref:retinol dehydrogenase 13-like isoform X2 n=1 Tax=Tubulanus polymorphus TaxID=672921 RepID=UPI003DA24CE5